MTGLQIACDPKHNKINFTGNRDLSEILSHQKQFCPLVRPGPWMRANRLSLNVAKTELMIIGFRLRLNTQCDEVDMRIDGEMIRRVDHTKSLVLTVDVGFLGQIM